MNGPRAAAKHGERGQILVIFALGLIAMIAMVGLVVDVGGAFAQRRVEQNAADLASLAGANAYLNAGGTVANRTAAAKSAATAAAARNGYTNGVNGAVVPDPTVELLQSGARVRVFITGPHTNFFARVVGQGTWDVSVVAAAVSGTVDTGVGAAPWTMNIGAFNPDGSPKYGPSNPQNFGEANGDYPISALDMAWTDFNGNNNVNSNEVRSIIDSTNVVTATFGFGQYLGQHNQGNHTTLWPDVNTYLAGDTIPIPIVGPGPCAAPQQAHLDGCFKGWAMFHVISASGGSDKVIRGYFDPEGFVQQPLTVGECPANPTTPCGVITSGSFDNLIVRLTQ